MAINRDIPSLVLELNALVSELNERYKPLGRRFTLDGHLVGSLGEVYAHENYGVELVVSSNKGFDGLCKGRQVEIKVTQRSEITLSSQPEHLLAFRMRSDGIFEEIYNGPGAPVWDTVKHKPVPSNGQYRISLNVLRKLMLSVSIEQRLPPIRSTAPLVLVEGRAESSNKGPTAGC